MAALARSIAMPVCSNATSTSSRTTCPALVSIKRVQTRRLSVLTDAPRQARGSIRVSSVAGAPGDSSAGMSPELKAKIDELVATNKIVVFIKGTKDFPQCGFSNSVCQILKVMEVPFTDVNILESDRLRSGMKEYSQWPTFPQVYINGEFFGGADIMIQAYQSGELKEQLEIALNS